MEQERVIEFRRRQEVAQSAFLLAQSGDAGDRDDGALANETRRRFNLAPMIRDAAEAYFTQHKITWHRYASRGHSSQICCINFLMPLATRPKMLARFVQRALGGDLPEMLPVEKGPDSQPWFVGFEWIGQKNYLNEWPSNGRPTRGANVTSSDAILRYRRNGRTETLLVEWKYTESYGQPIDPKGNATRIGRYRDLAIAPAGPLRGDLGIAVEDFFWEPFYQLMRQQMLARGMEERREDGAERVRVLHIAPAANRALTKVTSPALQRFGDNAFKVFHTLLVNRDDFVSRTTEGLFGPLLANPSDCHEWSSYIAGRYAFDGGLSERQG